MLVNLYRFQNPVLCLRARAFRIENNLRIFANSVEVPELSRQRQVCNTEKKQKMNIKHFNAHGAEKNSEILLIVHKNSRVSLFGPTMTTLLFDCAARFME
jgi:hypothetical protein